MEQLAIALGSDVNVIEVDGAHNRRHRVHTVGRCLPVNCFARSVASDLYPFVHIERREVDCLSAVVEEHSCSEEMYNVRGLTPLDKFEEFAEFVVVVGLCERGESLVDLEDLQLTVDKS